MGKSNPPPPNMDPKGIQTFCMSATLSQGGLQPQRRALQDVTNDSFVCYQDLSEYVGFQNIE